MASQDWLKKDFYKILGVPADVSDSELTKKYHKLAHKYHPDFNPGDAAAEAKFKEISEAFSVLNDKQQRAEYDQIRAMGSGGPRFAQGSGGFEDLFGGFAGFGGQPTGGGRFNSADFGDFFTTFGAQGAGFGGPQRGSDINASTTVDFITAVQGDTISIRVGTEPIKVKIPAGIADGKKMRLRGKGEESHNGGPRGDLMLTVHVRKHPVFERDGKNLRIKLPVTFTEAAFGATVYAPSLQGEKIGLRLAAGTPSGRVLRVKGRGVPAADGAGDLLAEVQVVVPSHLSKEQAAALEKFREVEHAEDPRADLFARIGTN